MAEKIVCNPEVFSSRAYPGEDITKRCFVIMPFKSETDEDKRIQDVYKHHILPVAKKCGLDCTRADDRRYFRNGKPIMEQIWKAICTADIVIGDFTTSNPNVTYEAGIAHTIGKPLIGIVQHMSHVPFDYQHLRFITYTTTHEGYEKLEGELEVEITEYLKELEEEYPQEYPIVVSSKDLVQAQQNITILTLENVNLRAHIEGQAQTVKSLRDELAENDQALNRIAELEQELLVTQAHRENCAASARKNADRVEELEQELAVAKSLKPELDEILSKQQRRSLNAFLCERYSVSYDTQIPCRILDIVRIDGVYWVTLRADWQGIRLIFNVSFLNRSGEVVISEGFYLPSG